jgi:formamidopyrimidine-DNA glycosylase
MPELPEVETVCRGLAKALTGARVVEARAYRADLRAPLPADLAHRLKNRRFQAITRRAKYILIALDKDETLLLHLGMSGRMTIHQAPQAPGKHDHVTMRFDNGAFLCFNDPRRFGLCDLVASRDLAAHQWLRHLGIEPLSDDLTPEALLQRFKGKKTAIKLTLLDQTLIAGIGNIYACEALYHAGIHPERAAGSCTKAQIAKLIPAIRNVLNAAIAAGGSSLRDYVQSDGELGWFQNQFAVYAREGQPCPDCTCNPAKTGGIRRITQGGRSTFFCATKQK